MNKILFLLFPLVFAIAFVLLSPNDSSNLSFETEKTEKKITKNKAFDNKVTKNKSIPKQITESKVIEKKDNSYDCAKNYDKYREIYHTKWNPNDSINSKNNYLAQAAMSEIEEDLLENSCFISVKEWAHNAQYQNNIWSSDWQKSIEFNKKYLESVQ